jgi:hypothetical protein
MDLAAVMDEVAARLATIAGLRVFAYPPGSVEPPAAVVSYPGDYTFDGGYARGMDRMTLPVVIVVGKPTDRSTRTRIAAYVAGSGASSIKALLDGDGYTSCDSVRAVSIEFDVEPVGGGDHLTAVFELDIVGQGA